LAQFEEAARQSAECGATHLVITEDLPVAQRQFDAPREPYPPGMPSAGLVENVPAEVDPLFRR